MELAEGVEIAGVEAGWVGAVAGDVCAGALPAQRRRAAEIATRAIGRMNEDSNIMDHSI
jgi:hypothetical protein